MLTADPKVVEPEEDTKIHNGEDLPKSSETRRWVPTELSFKGIFTLDDVPYRKWSERLKEFHAWLTKRALIIQDKSQVMTEFVIEVLGTFRDWYTQLSEYEQLQYVQIKDFHQEMNKLYYGIGADVNLKPLFLSSIPEDLSTEVKKSFLKKNKWIIDATPEQIHQEVHLALKDLCEKRKAFKEFPRGNTTIEKGYIRLGLKIKSKEKTCECPRKRRIIFEDFLQNPTKPSRYHSEKDFS